MVGESISPGSQTRSITVMAPLTEGETMGGQNYNTAWAYLNNYLGQGGGPQDNIQNVMLQRYQNDVLPTLKGAYNTASEKISTITSDADYQARLARAEQEYKAANPAVTGGSFTERVPGFYAYNRDLTTKQNQANQALKEMEGATDPAEFAAAQNKYNQSVAELNDVLKTNPNTYAAQENKKYSAGINYAAGYGEGGRLPSPRDQQAMANTTISQSSIDTAKAIGDMLVKIVSEGGRPTADQYQDYQQALANAGISNMAGRINPVEDYEKNIASKIGATSRTSEFTPELAFPNVASKSEIEAGIAAAKLTPTSRDDLMWENQAEQFRENMIGLSAQYHGWAGKQGVPTAYNPYDLLGDVALNQQQKQRNLTGKNLTQLPSEKDYLSAISGNQAELVRQVQKNGPGVYGKFADGTNVADWLARSYAGPAGGKMLQPSEVLPNIPVRNMDQLYLNVAKEGPIITQPSTARGAIAGSLNLQPDRTPLADLNAQISSIFGIGTVGAAEPIGLISEGTATPAPLPKFEDYYNNRLNKYESDVAAYTQGGSSNMTEYNRLIGEEKTLKTLGNIAQMNNMVTSQMEASKAQEKAQDTGPFGFITNLLPKQTEPTPYEGKLAYNRDIIQSVRAFSRGDIGGSYGYLNQAMTRLSAPLMPNISQMEIRTPTGTLVRPFLGDTEAEKANEITSGVMKGAYNYVRERPLDITSAYVGGLTIPGAEAAGARVLAGAAERNIPLISTLARSGSASPLAHDVYALATRVGLPAYFGYETKQYIEAAPTTTERAERLGATGVNIAALSGGILNAGQFPGAANRYYPKEYTPLEKGWNKLTTEFSIIGKTPSEKTAIRNLFEPAYETRFIKPAKTTGEIDLTELTGVKTPENAAAIEAAANMPYTPPAQRTFLYGSPLEPTATIPQTVSAYGSGVIKVGASDLKTGKRLVDLALPSKDYDAFAQHPELFYETVAQKIGGKVVTVEGKPTVIGRNGNPVALDIHGIPGQYPIGVPSEEVGVMDYLFGRPRFKVNPYIDELTQPGITPKYEGKLTYEQLNVQESKSFNDLLDDLIDPVNKGYRIPKAAARTKLIFDDLVAVAEDRGVTPAQAKKLNDAKARLEKTYDQTITYTEDAKKGIVRTETLNDAMNRYIATKKNPFSGGNTARPSTGLVPSLAKYSASVTASGISKGTVRNIQSNYSSKPAYSFTPSQKSPSPSPVRYSPSGSRTPSSPKPPSSPTPYSPDITPPSITTYNSRTIYNPPSSPSPPSPSTRYGYVSITTTTTPPSSIITPTPTRIIAPGVPFLAGPGSAGGGAGRGRHAQTIVKNPLNRLIVATAQTKYNFERAFSGGPRSSLKAEPVRKGNLNIINKITASNIARPNIKTQKNKSGEVNIVNMFNKKKGKRGMAF
jgi:hypothetical protein